MIAIRYSKEMKRRWILKKKKKLLLFSLQKWYLKLFFKANLKNFFEIKIITLTMWFLAIVLPTSRIGNATSTSVIVYYWWYNGNLLLKRMNCFLVSKLFKLRPILPSFNYKQE